VRALLEVLGEVGHTTLISTISVYADASRPGLDETAPVEEPADDSVDELTGDTYGPLKVACEQVVLTLGAARGMGVHIVRPGLIIGPRDPSGRFTWWPVRLAAGGTTVAPLPPEQPIQGIDARDLAAFLLHGTETGLTGVRNAVGVPTPLRELIDLCRAQADDPAEVVWVDGAWLEEQDVTPWMGLPLWLGTDPESAGFNEIDGAAARSAGLTTRTLADTARDVLAWARAEELDPFDLGAGLSRAQEAALVDGWEG
jgi:2'-hydroxyisoflavone reductase